MLGKVLCTILSLLMLASLPFPIQVMGGSAAVSVQPYIAKVWGTGETFMINITVTDIVNLYGWEIKLYFESSFLNCTSVSEGLFLKTVGSTYFNFSIENNYNSTYGRVKAFDTLLRENPGVNGTGVLLTATFKAKKLGITFLDLKETVLADINGNTMPHAEVDGAVEVAEAVHDVAVKSVSVSSNIVFDGQIVEIYVTAANLGNKTETFYVTIYGNETLLANLTAAALSPGANILLTFPWNTISVTPNATCIIKAKASEVLGETNLENNLIIYGAVHVVRGIHDVAVLDVRPASQEVYEGEILNIYVTVANKGNYTETFNVTLYSDGMLVGVRTVVNLVYGGTQELTFLWDTSGQVSKTYLIKAVASNVAGETRLTNNNSTATVTVYSRSLLSIKISQVIPCDALGKPVSGFTAGTIANFKVTLNCSLIGAKTILLTINMHDARGNTIGVVSFQGPVASGITTFILGMPIPTSANVGNAKVYANALSNWPHFGGIPYCPEVSATFEIRR
jgi:hypothetical protein